MSGQERGHHDDPADDDRPEQLLLVLRAAGPEVDSGDAQARFEAARNLAGIPDAGSEEFDHEAGEDRFTPVVYHLKEWVQGNHKVERKLSDDKGGTMRLGAYTAVLTPGSRISQVYDGATEIEDRHRHRYEVDARYRDQLEGCGLIFSGMSPDGRLPEAVEIEDDLGEPSQAVGVRERSRPRPMPGWRRSCGSRTLT